MGTGQKSARDSAHPSPGAVRVSAEPVQPAAVRAAQGDGEPPPALPSGLPIGERPTQVVVRASLAEATPDHATRVPASGERAISEASAGEWELPFNERPTRLASEVPVSARGAHAYLGTVLDGRYVVETVLGEGGMGVVYRCRHQVMDKVVAIKVLRQEIARDPELMGRFVNEARAASAIGNPHIVETIDFGQLQDGSTYFAMEYLEGRTLAQLLAKERTPAIEFIVDVGKQIAEALGAAHDVKIIHRDLKPDNVFITRRGRVENFVKILDFGIAKVATAQNKLTQAGAVFGTPHYMSPEQALGTVVDHRTDIYALGVILYELATGRVPFDAEGPMSILSQHVHLQLPAIGALPDLPRPVPAALEAIILKCLAKDPEDRYESMLLLHEDLERFERGATPSAALDSGARASPAASLASVRSRRRWVRLLVLIGSALMALGASTAWLWPRVSGEMPALVRRTLPSGTAVLLELLSESDADLDGPAPLKAGHHLVHLIMLPIDAQAYRDGESLGVMPVTLRVKQGERIELQVRRDGYYSKRVTIDGKKARVVVRLVPVAGPATARPDRGSPQNPVNQAPEPISAGNAKTEAPADAKDTKPAHPVDAKSAEGKAGDPEARSPDAAVHGSSAPPAKAAEGFDKSEKSEKSDKSDEPVNPAP